MHLATTTEPILLIVSAPSGAGKTTICQGLLDADDNMRRVITCTTRPPRKGETDGIDYHFLSRSIFEKNIRDGDFLEYADVYGNFYGTRKKEVFEEDKDLVINIDIQGANTIREKAKNDLTLSKRLVTVFLTPPSLDELESRLTSRDQDEPDVIRTRMANAKREIAEWHHFDYLIISGTRQQDLSNLLSIVQAERLKSKRHPVHHSSLFSKK